MDSVDEKNRLIITKVPQDVFADIASKTLFEDSFREFDPNAEFIFLRSFRRVIVTMTSGEAAFLARFKMQGWRLPMPSEVVVSTANNSSDGGEADCGIRCYFADEGEHRRNRHRQQRRTQPAATTSFEDDDARLTEEECEVEEQESGNIDGDEFEYLAPPKPDKLFLLSPPSSPPVGWEPRIEAEPVINYELLRALASMEPGKDHELHPSEKDQPSIVVTPCEGLFAEKRGVSAVKIVQTQCPPPKEK